MCAVKKSMKRRRARSPAAAIIAGTGKPVAGSMMASAVLLLGRSSGSCASFMASPPILPAISTLTCSFARRDAVPAGLIPADKGLDHPIEESRRQKAVIVAVAVRPFAQVVAGPEKFIAFGDDDPGWIVVEPEM